MNALSISKRADPRLRRPARPARQGLSGALAGLGGGLAMMVIATLLAHALDQDAWLLAKSMASLGLGSSATAADGFVALPVLLGLLMQLAAAALLGVLFELGVRRLARRSFTYLGPELLGLLAGFAIWLVAYVVVLPALAPALLDYGLALLIQHMVYGAVTGVLLPQERG